MDTVHTTSLWTKVKRLFGISNVLEKAIEEAKEEGEIEDSESTMLMGILELRSLSIGDIMTPRSQMEALPNIATLSEAAEFIKETGYSRIPVYRETKDTIVGILYARDIVYPLLDHSHLHSPAVRYAKEAFFTTETKPVYSLLEEIKKRKCHIAIVLDRFGGTAGLVTVSDILETVFGKLYDEYDEVNPDEEIQKVNESTFLVPGKTPLEELQSIDITLESDEVDTLGGYISHQLGTIPEEGDIFTFNGITYTVVKADKKQIDTVQVNLASQSSARLD